MGNRRLSLLFLLFLVLAPMVAAQNVTTGDVDKDGIPDEKDNCPTVYNPDQKDANQNRIGDACEAPTQTPQPTQPAGDECIRKYMDAYKLSYEEAKERCYPSKIPEPTPSPMEECIKRYQQQGYPYEKAKELCTAQPQPLPAPPEDCVKRYMETYKLSYEEAKAKCYPPAPTPTVSPVEGCIKKYQELGYSYEEAKKACTAQPAPPDRCAELKQKLLRLEEVQKLLAAGKIKESELELQYMGGGLEAETQKLRQALAACEAPPLTCEAKAKLEFERCLRETKDEKACKERYEKLIVLECRKEQLTEERNCEELKKRLAVLAGKLPRASTAEAASVEAEIQKLKNSLAACEVAPRVVDRCTALKGTILKLEEELKKATPEDAQKIENSVEVYRKQLAACEKPEVAPGVKNPCDEVKILKESLEQLSKKIAYLKESITKGEMNESSLEPYYREADYLKKHLDRMSFACQQGKPIEESPCARLSKLEVVYRELHEKLGATKDEKEADALKEKLEAITREILALKEKCRAASIQAEKPESVLDVEKIYETKVREAVASQSRGELPNELRKIEEEKAKLIEEFAARVKELDLRRTTIIKKTKIAGDEVSLDEIKVGAPKVKMEVEGKELEINLKPGEVAITQGNVTARGNVTLEYSEGRLTGGRSGKPIKVLPSDVRDKVTAIDDEPTWGIEIDDEPTRGPRYTAKGDKGGRFLGIVPVTVLRTLEINAENGEIIKDTKPWWSALVFG